MTTKIYATKEEKRLARNARAREKYASDPEFRARCRAIGNRISKEMTPEQRRANHLMHRFGISPQQYDEMFEAQGGVCAICRQPGVPDGNRMSPLEVDHDHRCCAGVKTCGKCVRGLVCRYCNRGLGQFRDDPELLVAAVAYLARHL